MSIRRTLLAAILLAVALAIPLAATAQVEETPAFSDYAAMRAELDALMSKRRIAELLTTFGGGDEMSAEDMAALEAQVRDLFREDFRDAAVMIRQDMESGFAQELIAYWTGTAYMYVRLLWHARPEGDVIAINMMFNSNPDALIPLF